MHHALHRSCLASDYHFTITIPLMSAHCNLRSHSPLKTVFGKLGDIYQAYCNTHKTHTMATHHGGLGQPLDGDIEVTGEPQILTLRVHRTSIL